MRAHILALSIVLAACAGESGGTDTADATVDGAAVDATIDALLIDAPTDAQIWPPANVSIEIGAAAAGDVDGDGRDDLLLAVSGSIGHIGLHVFRGGVDLDDHGAVVGAPDFGQLVTIMDPMALVMYDGLPVVISGGGGNSMAVFDHDLSLFSRRTLPYLPGQTDTLVLSPVAIGAAGALAIGEPTQLHHVERGALRLNPPTLVPLSQPPTPFTAVRGVASDASGTLVVAEPGRVAIGTPPAVIGGAYTWAQRPLSGAPWVAELVADVTGDGRPDVIGYRKPVGNAQLCVHDGSDAPGLQPVCKVLPGQNAEYVALLLADIDPSPGPDLIVVIIGTGVVEAYPDLGTNLGAVSSGPRHTMTLPRSPAAMVAIDVDDDGDNELMLVDRYGALRCVALTTTGFVDC